MLTQNELFVLVAEALEIDHAAIDCNSSSKNVTEWDSLGQLVILTALQKHSPSMLNGVDNPTSLDSIEKLLTCLEIDT